MVLLKREIDLGLEGWRSFFAFRTAASWRR